MTENTENQIEEEVAEETAASAAVEADTAEINTAQAEGVAEEQTQAQTDEKPAPLSKKQQFIQILKFTAFSISAGAIQLLSFSILYEWAKCLPWWPAYLISIVLSVIWNFTFNRKFTFASAANVPLAMALVTVYYCMFIPVSVFGGDALEKAWGENLGIVVTVLMMIINFVTEFLWDKFLVFNDRVMKKIEGLFKRKKKDE
ncbi:MAG: GtrA family protein [Clostridia bacterium]|nr:GtrA family protein [Clostridia bacterium]